ncbi:hypothetical protein DRW07_10800 [Alteromonas sediminis]|uniref:Peptidase M1 membrane alanine aminopeptidase domain-containing protein n=1 Tax=Alteromonas sediminis TaxID=2259342 RepID=A0A3N5Y1V2_9ALTE|nr:M1 family aminopeptidase [Alteromonas sediminis]RPJ66566.1 hypothetical protein DRW07_10800 [Alteromonas sediminis]
MMFRSEWALLMRQPLVWVSVVLLPGFAFLLAMGTHRDEAIASQQLQMLEMTLLLMVLPIMCGALSPISFLRDQTYNMRELIEASPVSVALRYLVRLGVVASFALVMVIIGYATLSWAVVSKLNVEYAFFSSTLWMLAVLAVPSILFLTSLALWVCRRFPNRPVVYALFAAVWLGYMTLASMTGSPIMAGSAVANEGLLYGMKLLDPYGITAILAQYKVGYTEVTLDVYVIFNRLLYVLLAALLTISALRCSPAAISSTNANTKGINKTDPNNKTVEISRVAPRIRFSSGLQQICAFHLTGLLNDHLTKLLLIAWSLVIFSESVAGIDFAEPLSVLLPSSVDAFNRVAWDVMPVMGTALLLLWSWQMCWRGKQCGFAEFIGTTPVSSFALALGQFLALLGMLAILMLLSAAGVFAAEIFANSQILPMHYVAQLGFTFIQLALMGAIFIAIHTWSTKQLVAGGVIAFILLVKLSPLTGILEIAHPLWDIAGTPLQAPDRFWGYQASLSSYLPFTLFWLITVCALFLVAVNYSHRGTGIANSAIRWITMPSLVLIVVSVVSGIVLHISLHNEHPMMSSADRAAWRADYERNYLHWADVAQPVVTALDNKVALFPEQGFAEFDFTMTLTNQTDQAIDSILIGGYSTVKYSSVSLHNAELTEHSERLNQYVFSLSTPLMPGQNTSLHVSLRQERRTLWPASMHHIIHSGFTYLRGIPMMPVVGFNHGYRLRNNERRADNGLAEMKYIKPSSLSFEHSIQEARYDRVSMRTVISTQAGHTALTQGALVDSWQQNGRHYFEYETAERISNIPTWISVPFASQSDQVGDVSLLVYSPMKTDASQINLLAMKDTVEWLSENIHAYRGKRLSMVATPNIGSTGYALPQLMLINHKVGFRAFPAEDAGFDQRYRRAVHETAHQWFGHDIGNGVLEDGAFLIESMAKYVELVMIEKRYGKAAKDALVDYEYRRYQMGRARSKQPTEALVNATDSFDQYSRATIVFDKLREMLGDEVIVSSLQQLWQQHGYPQRPATSMDFVRILKDKVQDQDRDAIEKLLLGTDVRDWL